MLIIDCPNCKEMMSLQTYEGVKVHRCEQCGGVWLGSAEMSLIVQRRIEAFDDETIAEVRKRVRTIKIPPEERERNRPCPVCHKSLTPFNYNYSSGIIVDRCPDEHGIFLDAGELELVQAHAELLDAAVAGTVDTYRKEKSDFMDDAVRESMHSRKSNSTELEASRRWEARQKEAKQDNSVERILNWIGKMLD